MKFKVGDRVRSLYNKGEYYVVSEGSNSSYIRCRNDENVNIYTTEEDLELVENSINVYKDWADYNDKLYLSHSEESKQDKVDRLKKELEEAEKALDKPPFVSGYEMKIVDDKIYDVVAFGCARIPYRFFRDIDCLSSGMKTSENLLVCNRSIKSITLDSGVEISIEKCEEIVEYYNKNK